MLHNTQPSPVSRSVYYNNTPSSIGWILYVRATNGRNNPTLAPNPYMLYHLYNKFVAIKSRTPFTNPNA